MNPCISGEIHNESLAKLIMEIREGPEVESPKESENPEEIPEKSAEKSMKESLLNIQETLFKNP